MTLQLTHNHLSQENSVYRTHSKKCTSVYRTHSKKCTTNDYLNKFLEYNGAYFQVYESI